jgi:hypothetical protein
MSNIPIESKTISTPLALKAQVIEILWKVTGNAKIAVPIFLLLTFTTFCLLVENFIGYAAQAIMGAFVKIRIRRAFCTTLVN